MLLGVDVGGTFTDAVLADDGRLWTAKAPSTPEDQSRGVLAAVREVLRKAGRGSGDVRAFGHGMTVATNALLEGNAARTVLLATRGFTDVVELGRQARAELYRLCAAHPPPLVPPDRRIAVDERTAPDGPLEPLTEDGARAAAERAAELKAEAVAVVLLHSYRHPEHERKLGDALRAALPGAAISLSHEVTGTFREYERAATTEVDAALSPLLGRYLRALAGGAREAGLPVPAIMQSGGGLTDLDSAAEHAALTVLSGPAAGAAGAAYAAHAAGLQDALCFDMGGTSCDVCVVQGGAVRETAGREVGGRPLALPMLDVHTVGAGGGSIAWRDAGGALRVGPRSAGAEPGPACYGRGGTEPTVTDANLVLGYLPANSPLAGGVALDAEAAAGAVDRLAAELGLDRDECAAGIVRVANAEMIRALRVMTVERGVDPRDFALVAFGGAGGLHAAAIAEELGMRRILCPAESGVLAALGLVVAPRRRDVQRSVLRSGAELTAEAIRADVDELAGRARSDLGDEDAALRTVFDVRYRGQAFELSVEAPPDPAALRDAFARAHEERYGYADPEGETELVTVRVTATTPAPAAAAAPRGAGAREPAGTRPAVLGGQRADLRFWRGAPAPGAAIAGPAVCELPEATLLVPPGWAGTVTDAGAIMLERED